MREITQTEKYKLRGHKVMEKIGSIIKSGRAEEILIEDSRGDVKFRITPDSFFIKPTMDMVHGIIRVIRECTLVVINKQQLLFN